MHDKIIIGDATFYHGDCLEVLRSFPDNSIEYVITDPPYSSGGMFRGDRVNRNTIEKYQNNDTVKEYPDFLGDNRDQRSFGYWSALWLSECHRICIPAGIVCVFTDWRQLPISTDYLQAGGFVWRGIAVWDKTEAARPRKGGYRNQCEYIIWGSKGSIPNEGPCLPGVFRKCINIKDKMHVTGKPTETMVDILKIACRENSTVLDPFMGSGTTAVASYRSHRKFIGIEKEKKYFDIAIARYRREISQLRICDLK